MTKRLTSYFLACAMVLSCSAWASAAPAETVVTLSDRGVTVDGKSASTKTASAVYVGADLVYYESGRDETYGAGTEQDGHDAAEAQAHTVVTITQPGTYRLTGSLSLGQVAVDLGEGAETDPGAVVTLILDNVDLTCTAAPAVIFYRVYECGSADTATASPTVDTSAAGANVVIADGSVNNIDGSYVAKIYREGTEKKLHKYDGAFYSKMSMNVTGEAKGDGVLNITAENEGLDAELHLTIHGGIINITAQNDGINTNEDGVSVTTINGGLLTIDAGLGSEGDGIDSNGYLVVNGGAVTAMANPRSGDAGLDADLGGYLNGGTVVATGSRNDDVDADSRQGYMALSFSGTVGAGSTLTLRDASGADVLTYSTPKDYASAVLSVPDLQDGETYTLYVDGIQQQYTSTGGGMGGFPGGMGGGQRPQGGDGQTPPALPEDGQMPQNGQPPEGGTPPDGIDGQRPQGGFGGRGQGSQGQESGASSTAFPLTASSRSFSGVSAAAALPFTDVSTDSASYEAVRYLYGQGVMNGTSDTQFSPDQTVSRAMAVTVLARLSGAVQEETQDFTDVSPGSWYSGYVGWAVENGVVLGDGAGRFLPDDSVTGEQMALMLTRCAALTGGDYTASNLSTSPLTRAELARMLYSYSLA